MTYRKPKDTRPTFVIFPTQEHLANKYLTGNTSKRVTYQFDQFCDKGTLRPDSHR